LITLTRLNQVEVVINCDLIESIESTPDTIVTLTTSKKLSVRESVDDVVSKVVAYKKRLAETSL